MQITSWHLMSSIMNKKVLLLVVLLLSLSNIYSQNVLEDIKDRGVLRVGVLDKDVYPFVYREKDGSWVGFEIVRAMDIASKLGVKSEFVTYNSIDEVKVALNGGEIDIFFHKRFKTLSDGLDTLITKPLASLEMVLIINRREFAGLKLHPNLKKSFLQGDIPVSTRDEESFLGSFYKEFPNLTLNNKSMDMGLWDGVKKGTEISIYQDEASVKTVLSESPELGLNLAYLPLEVTQEIVALVSWKESFFLDWVNIAIEGWGDPKNMSEVIKISEGERNE